MVKTDNIVFITELEIKATRDKKFDEDKLRKDYQNNPNRMTKEQMRLCGGMDRVWDSIISKFIDNKSEWYNNSLIAVKNSVCQQMQEIINKEYPALRTIISVGKYSKYGYGTQYPKLIIQGNDGEGMRISPTLSEEDENYFHIAFTDPEILDVYCSDVETLNIVKAFDTFVKTGEKNMPAINKIYHKYENQYILQFAGHAISLYDIEFVQMYNTLAKDANKELGTDFPYSQTMIDKLTRHEVFGNIQKIGGFYLSVYTNRNFNIGLRQFYYYDDCGRCNATYGDEWTREDIISLLSTLKPYVMNNYFVSHSKDALEQKYKDYDRMHIGYSEYPNYFNDMLWEK